MLKKYINYIIKIYCKYQKNIYYYQHLKKYVTKKYIKNMKKKLKKYVYI